MCARLLFSRMAGLDQQFPPSVLVMVRNVVPSLKALALRALAPVDTTPLRTCPPEVLLDWSNYVQLTRRPDHYRLLVSACLQRGACPTSFCLQSLTIALAEAAVHVSWPSGGDVASWWGGDAPRWTGLQQLR